MQTLTLVMGLPGSGKTELSSRLNGLPIHIDEIRKAVTGSYRPGNTNDLVYQITQRTVYYHLEKGKNVILDGSLLSVKTRIPYIRMAKKLGIVIELYWLDPTYPFLMKRIADRNKMVENDRKMDLQYLDKLSRLFEMPSTNEGFDQIYHLSDDDLL